MHHQPRVEFKLPASLLDVFMLISLILMLELRDQGVAFQLPRLVEGDAAAPATLASIVTQHVQLRSDGRLLLNEGEVALDELVERLKQTDEAIELAIEIDDAGRGATEELLRVQIALSRAELLPRVRLAASEQKRGER